MFSKNWMKVPVVVVLCALVSFGCKTRTPVQGGPIDGGIIGEQPLSERFEDGTPVVDFTADKVNFEYDSFQISQTELPKIQKVFDYMQANARVRLIAEGNCDERGSREYNMSLGEQRAGAVRAQLVGLGIAAERIQTKSFGKEKPLNLGHDDRAWAENRRVEFALYN